MRVQIFSASTPQVLTFLPFPKLRRALESQEQHLTSYLISNTLYYDRQSNLSDKEVIFFINHQACIINSWSISRARCTFKRYGWETICQKVELTFGWMSYHHLVMASFSGGNRKDGSSLELIADDLEEGRGDPCSPQLHSALEKPHKWPWAEF